MAELSGHVAMLTGAGRLGRAIATELANAGAAVGVVDANGDAAAEVAAELRAHGAKATHATVDVSRAADVDAALEHLEHELGPVDLLVNAHGIFPNTPVVEVDESEWDRVFDVNTKGTMLTCRAVARRLLRRGAPGSIVNISSAAATSARAGSAHYTGSKAAVNLLTHTLAIELGPHAIRVNAVAPGLVLDEVLRDETAHSSE